MTDGVACELGILVGGVFAPRLIVILQVRDEFSPGHIQEWPDELGITVPRKRSRCGNTRQAINTGAAQDAKQDGFRLVVAGVRGRDVARVLLLRSLDEQRGAEIAGGFFHGAAAGDGRSALEIRKVQFICQGPHKRGIFVGRSPTKFVIGVTDR